jgi:23S rRNA pseudouridine2605 synthase
MKLIRLNKFIAESGICSRRKADELILQERIQVNSKTVSDLGSKIDPDVDKVSYDGETINIIKHVYVLMNKPKGVVTTTADEKNRRTVVDLVAIKEKVFPVGRLDYNTTGVLLLTNDGDFAYYLTHPKNKVRREYSVNLDRSLSKEDAEKMKKGVFIDGVRGKFISVVYPNENSGKFVVVTTEEGRNHFVKNMFQTLGYTVTGLNRDRFGDFTADIPTGSFRILTDIEVNRVKEKYEKRT